MSEESQAILESLGVKASGTEKLHEAVDDFQLTTITTTPISPITMSPAPAHLVTVTPAAKVQVTTPTTQNKKWLQFCHYCCRKLGKEEQKCYSKNK